MRASFLVLLLVLVTGLGGCASRAKKSSSRFYDGDAPTLHMTERQRVGGPVTGN